MTTKSREVLAIFVFFPLPIPPPPLPLTHTQYFLSLSLLFFLLRSSQTILDTPCIPGHWNLSLGNATRSFPLRKNFSQAEPRTFAFEKLTSWLRLLGVRAGAVREFRPLEQDDDGLLWSSSSITPRASPFPGRLYGTFSVQPPPFHP